MTRLQDAARDAQRLADVCRRPWAKAHGEHEAAKQAVEELRASAEFRAGRPEAQERMRVLLEQVSACQGASDELKAALDAAESQASAAAERAAKEPWGDGEVQRGVRVKLEGLTSQVVYLGMGYSAPGSLDNPAVWAFREVAAPRRKAWFVTSHALTPNSPLWQLLQALGEKLPTTADEPFAIAHAKLLERAPECVADILWHAERACAGQILAVYRKGEPSPMPATVGTWPKAAK